ncbi:MAG: SH3 domain-containing protein [Saprospiraceae bacterium]|nr:SH3 domain-containing protein [Saprospiraceae bacterium]
MQRLLILCALLFLFACKKENKNVGVPNFTTNVESTRLRETPGEDGKVIQELAKGTVLYDLGEVSDFTTRVQLRGIWLDEPWLKVRTKDGKQGWIYGGALSFNIDEESPAAKQLIEKRLQTIFGKELADSIRIYREAFQNIQTEQDFAATFRQGSSLRDTLTNIMQDRILIQNPAELPDMFWLSKAMPGLVPQLVAEGTAYYLFWSFAALNAKAKTTPEAADDDFVAMNLTLFPEDSIEYFFPAWFMQTWDYGGSSLLGRGVHYQTLENIDQQLKKSDLFAPELSRLKARILNDMTEPHVTYWEKQENIISEVDSIINANFSVLSDADKIALQTRRKQFDEPEKHGIQLNTQAGNLE